MQDTISKSLSKKTLAIDLIKAPTEGILKALVQTLALMIAIEYYEINDVQKSILSAGTHIGFLLCPAAILIIQKLTFKTNYVLGYIQLLSSTLLVMIYFNSDATIYVYVMATVFALLSFRPFLMTSIYQANYDHSTRGKLFGFQLILVTIFSLITISLIGQLRSHFSSPSLMILVFSLASFFIAIAFFSYPIKPLQKKDVRFKFFKILKEDKLFRNILIIWFIFGFANLSTIPLRTAFLMEEKYGYNYSFSQVSFLIGVLPTISQLLFIPVMSRAFDKYNFIKVRIALNIIIFLSIFLFFIVGSYWGFVASSILHGGVLAGGNIAWNLWVTKIAKSDNTSNYMVIHQFFTGVRGVSGPALAFWVTSILGVLLTATFCVILVLISILMLVPLLKLGNDLKQKKNDKTPIG